jgi:hypothetical protein
LNETLQKIQRAVEKTVGGSVSHVESRPVVETFNGNVIWRGLVEVFTVANPPPEKAYGWIVAAQDGPDYVAVLGTPPINAPLDAVRAWIVSDAKGKK